MPGNPDVIDSSVGFVPLSALVLTDPDLPGGASEDRRSVRRSSVRARNGAYIGVIKTIEILVAL